MKVLLLPRVSQLKRYSGFFFDKKEQETVTKKIISDRNEITESDIESAYASLKIS